ncbi:MAG: hypothetical protein OXN23_05090 [Gammaproteobacteria bacterium]|nr:hypothetical protein [Gammaproteobacteria bacterium]
MMDTVTIQIVSFQMAALVAILGFLWKLHHEVVNLHKDNADLRERMARVEGLLEGFVGRPPEPQS